MKQRSYMPEYVRVLSAIGAVVAALVAAAVPAYAQGIRPDTTVALFQGLTLTGHAEVKAQPDVAYIGFQVITTARSQTDASSDNATKSLALMAALKAAGVKPADIQTQSYSVDPQYNYQVSPASLTGYQVTNSIKVTVHDLTHVGPLLDTGIKAGASAGGGLTYDLVDRRHVEAEALVQAIQDVEVKATVMAAAAGVHVGRLVNLAEGTAPVAQPIFMNARMPMAAGMMGGGAAATPISTQEITVTSDVTASFLLDLAAK